MSSSAAESAWLSFLFFPSLNLISGQEEAKNLFKLARALAASRARLLFRCRRRPTLWPCDSACESFIGGGRMSAGEP